MKRFIFFMIPSLLFTNPKGEKLIHGQASFSRDDRSLTIQQRTEKAIIHWDSFSISKNELTAFLQPSANSAVLNRVIGENPTEIYGKLQSNAEVFLINENGILVGPEGVIATQSFVGSCLDLDNQDFLNNNYQFNGNKGAQFINEGKIDALKNIVVIAPKIVQKGELSAGENASLLAASTVYFQDRENRLLVKVEGEGSLDQSGNIRSAYADLRAAGGNVSLLAINQTGTVHATSVEERNGEIYLIAEKGTIEAKGELEAKSGKVHLLAGYVKLDQKLQIDVSGNNSAGEVLIGGDYKGSNPEIANAHLTYVGPDVTIDASCKNSGDGGKVILWGNARNQFYGNILAEGGKDAGDGGFVEISSPGFLDAQGWVSTHAYNGKVGTLLFDPVDVTISSGANANITPGELPVPPPAQPDPFTVTFDSDPATATINATALRDALAVNNIIIDTSLSAGGGAGNVTFDATAAATINWAAATGLTVIADRNITISGGVTLTNTSASTGFTAFDFQANTSAATTGGFDGIDFLGDLSTVNGNISFDGTSGPDDGFIGVYLDVFTTIETSGGTVDITGRGTNTGFGVQHRVNANIINSTGDTNLTGSPHPLTTSTRGIFDLGNIFNVDGDINIIGNGYDGVFSGGNIGDIRITGEGNLTITGTADADPLTGVGVHLRGGPVIVNNGNMTITGTSNEDGNAVEFVQGFAYSTTGSGNVSITGTLTNAYSGNNALEFSNNSGTSLLSSGGDISLIGEITGVNDATVANVNGIGFFTTNQSFTTTGDGQITVTGTSMAGSSGTGGGVGISFTDDTTFSSVNGNITLTGTGASEGGSGNIGIELTSATSPLSLAATGTGVVNISGTGGLGDDSHGLLIEGGSRIALSSGQMNITGTATSGNSDGVSISSTGSNSITLTGTDLVTITGIPSGTGNGIAVGGIANFIGGPGNGAPLVLNTDSLSLTGFVQGSNTLSVQPIANTTAINIGDSAPVGGLQLSSTEVSQIIDGFSEIFFGKSAANGGAHTITIDNGGLLTFNDPVTFRGNTVSILNPITVGADTVSAIIGQNGAGTLNLSAAVTASTFSCTGGSFDDVFNLNVSQAATYNGSGGFNTLNGPNTSTYFITSQNAGNIDGITFFTNMQNITAGNMPDTVIFSDGVGLDGLLDGGAPAAPNVLDYSNFTTPAVITFLTPTSGLASNLGIGWQNFGSIIGNFIVVIVPESGTTGSETYLNQIDLAFLYLNPSRDGVESYVNKILLGVLEKYPLHGLTWTLVNSGEVVFDKRDGFDLQSYQIKRTDIRRNIQAIDFFQIGHKNL